MRLREDVALLADMGVDACRFSSAWTLVIPDGEGPLHPAGIELRGRPTRKTSSTGTGTWSRVEAPDVAMASPAPPTGLPVEASIEPLRLALASAGHAVLVAPPGSGKTTVAPLRLVDEPWLRGAKVVVLEPRRLATRAAAGRMAHLLGEGVGDTVGYVTREERRVGPATRIEVVTEGVLTRRLQRDPELAGTGLVIFDEFHERNQQTDLGLALALDARATLRPDLAILVMSATLDPAGVARILGGDDEPAAIIESEARSHPVDVRWAPQSKKARFEDHVAATVSAALRAEPGDVLVFLPGMGEILRVRERLTEAGASADVHVLHGSLSAAEQDAALVPSPGRRKVVLATDIAETSLTVEGVRVVVDGGLARKPRFDARTGMTRLVTVAISRSSADQRAGRAGRTEPGVAYRLWSKLEHAGRKQFIEPEIAAVDLAGFALELAAWGVSDPADLRFLDPPSSRTFTEGRALLAELRALDHHGRLTAIGEAMAALPLHPRLAHMVVASEQADGYLACIVAALVDDRDILRGHPDDVPVDLAIRVRLVADQAARHPLAAGPAIARARRNAHDLARRAGISPGPVVPDHAGRVLALAYPDRLAIRRGSPGRFQLRTATTAWTSSHDPLGAESFLIAADLDGKRKDARIRLAAAIDAETVEKLFTDDIVEQRSLLWIGDRLTDRKERRIGGVALSTVDGRPEPGPDTTHAIQRRLADRDLADLPWSDAALALVDRVAFLRRTHGSEWPDWSRKSLGRSLDEWLVPATGPVSGLDDLASIDLFRILRSRLDHRRHEELDRLAPRHIVLPNGRRVAIDYSGDEPVLSARAQDLFGLRTTPEIGGVPVVVHVLSPAGRPVQITRDLEGFWAGSWQDVRKEMAGRYPKHDWPADPGR